MTVIRLLGGAIEIFKQELYYRFFSVGYTLTPTHAKSSYMQLG